MNIVIDKKKIVIILVLVIIGALLGAAKFYIVPKRQALEREKQTEENVYSVVYLITGEVYVGHLKTWPKMELKDAYQLQVVKDPSDPAKTNTQLTPLKEAPWAPKQLFLNEKNVIFYGPIEEGSKAAEAMRNVGK